MAAELRLVGVQASEATVMGAVRERDAEAVVALYVAVTVAV